MVQQLIYTSAQRLLEAGRSGFGTVARTKSLSPLAVGAIERLSQFANLRGYDRKRVILAHRRLTVANSRFHLLTSIRDAGSDYTGRTSHIAQHLIIPLEDARALTGAGLTPADILGRFPWMKSWSGSPKVLGDSDAPDLTRLDPIRHPGERAAWAQVTGNPLHARLLASSAAPRTGVIIVPDGIDPLPLLSEALGEMDSPWGLNFTTCLEQSDELGDFQWIVTSDSLSAAVEQRCGSRTRYHLGRPSQLPVPEEKVGPTPTPEVARPEVASREAEAQAQSVAAEAPKHEQRSISQGVQSDYSGARGATAESQRGPHVRVRESSRLKFGLLVGSIAAVLLAFAGLGWTFLKNGKDPAGGSNSGFAKFGSESGESELTRNQQDFVKKVTGLGIGELGIDDKKKPAEKLAKKIKDEDLPQWAAFFVELRSLAEDPTWKKISNIKCPAYEQRGLPSWVDELLGDGKPELGIPGLKTFGEELEKHPPTLETWEKLKVIAESSLARSPVFASKDPFPRLTEESVTEHVFNAELSKEKILEIIDHNCPWNKAPSSEILEKALEAFLKREPDSSEQEDHLKKRRGVIVAAVKGCENLHKSSLEEVIKRNPPIPVKEGQAKQTEKMPPLQKGPPIKQPEPYRPELEYYLFTKGETESAKQFDLLKELFDPVAIEKKSDLELLLFRGETKVTLDGKDVPLLIQTRKGGMNFCHKPHGVDVFGISRDGILTVPKGSKWRDLKITCSGAILHVGRAGSGDESPLWGKFTFELKGKVQVQVHLDGKLVEQIKAFESSQKLVVHIIDPKGSYPLDLNSFELKGYDLKPYTEKPKSITLKRYEDKDDKDKKKKDGKVALEESLKKFNEVKDKKATDLTQEEENDLHDRQDKARENLMNTLEKVYPTEQTEKAIGSEFSQFSSSVQPAHNDTVKYSDLNKHFDKMGPDVWKLLSGFAQHVLKLEDNTEALVKWNKKKKRIDAENDKKLKIERLEVRTKDGTLIFVGVRSK